MRISAAAAIFVAVVAGGGAIRVAVYAAVLVVGLRLLVRRLRMAVDTSKTTEVRRHLVAVIANRAVVRNRKERTVIESSAEPAGGVVATSGVAGRRETCGNVIRHRAAESLRALPCCEMAAIASGVPGGERVVAIDVARRTRSFRGIGVSAGQRPTGSAVIEFSVGPEHCVVAGGTLCCREAGGNVIGNRPAEWGGAVPIGLVTAVAIGICGSKRVVATDMALRAG